MILEDIKNLPKQFEYVPEVKNTDKLGTYHSYIVGGMGGSGAVAGYLRAADPRLQVIVHHDYGVPGFLEEEDRGGLFIAVSHSGNTEETLDFFNEALKRKYHVAAIASKGKLLELAEQKGVPYVDIPGDLSQPRISQGFMLRAALKLMGQEATYKAVERLAQTLKPLSYEGKGKEVATSIHEKIPIIYSSRSNFISAFSWKRILNETGKIPAFYNVFPELNHNEMQGFDVVDATKALSANICFIFLEDDDDHERIRRRMEVTSKLYEDRGLQVEHIRIDGEAKLEKLFDSIALAEWTGFYTSQKYGTEPEAVPMVEEFKKIL